MKDSEKRVHPWVYWKTSKKQQLLNFFRLGARDSYLLPTIFILLFLLGVVWFTIFAIPYSILSAQ